MTSRDAARTHLRKAREFLDAASVSRDLGLVDAATSAAVIAGVNAKDAKSQYQAVSVSATDAGKAIEWATRLVGAAHEDVTSR